ncbi:MAG: hypothetical protein H6571_09790 [Lewinellaceae bacterium]|nr:hypothetical protein [Lewinellaceae bacterium]
MQDLFNPTISQNLNKYFVGFQKHRVYEPGRYLINKIFEEMGDQDGNFKDTFQSGGFWGRLLELFLFKFIKEQEIEIINGYAYPDFHLKKDNLEFFIEATTSNPSKDEEGFSDLSLKNAIASGDYQKLDDSKEHYSIKLGSVLRSKVNRGKSKNKKKKEYWELDWVKGKPFLIAIAVHHHFLTKDIPDLLFFEYLYGKKINAKISSTGKLLPSISNKKSHHLGQKEIPSNFFNLPNSEHVSAVIFVNTSDFWKFNRMGFENNYFTENIIMQRTGYKLNPAPNSHAIEFSYTVGENPVPETWREGVRIFHNPKALNPLDSEIFKNVAQTWINDNGPYGTKVKDSDIISSKTCIWDTLYRKNQGLPETPKNLECKF